MPASLFIGLVIVVVGFVAARVTLFETRGSGASDEATQRTLTVPSAGGLDTLSGSGNAVAVSTGIRAAVGVHRPSRQSRVNVRWYQRVRSGLLLALLAIGFGMAIGGALGLVALLVSFMLG